MSETEAITADEVVAIAKQNRGRYLLAPHVFRDKRSPKYRACAELVARGRARWLGVKTIASEGLGEPGPGIQLLGKDATEAAS